MAVKDNPYHWRALFGSVGLYLGFINRLLELHKKDSTGRKFTMPTKLVMHRFWSLGLSGPSSSDMSMVLSVTVAHSTILLLNK